MTNLLTPSDVKNRYGYERTSLLRWEQQGLLSPQRTPGGHRRYSIAELDAMSQTQTPDRGGQFHEMGSTGIGRWTTPEEFRRDKLKDLGGTNQWHKYREMVLNDPIIAAMFFAIENVLKKPTPRVVSISENDADKQAALFVEECLHDMSFSWSDTMTSILDMLETGFSVLEIVYKIRDGTMKNVTTKYDDNRIGWRKWAPRPAETLPYNNPWIIDEHGGIHGVTQELLNGGTVTIPIEKFLLFRTTVRPGNNPYGMPLHRTMFTSYWYTQNLQEIEGIGIERDLTGIPVIYLGTDCTTTGANNDFDLAKDLVTHIRMDEQTGVVIPRPKLGTGREGEGMLLELLSTSGRRAHDTSSIIERYDKRKTLAVLAQFIMLGMESAGSFALSKTLSDLFLLAISAWITSIADVINRHAIPRLVDMNHFPGITGYPKLVFSDLGLTDLGELAEFVNKLVDAEVLTPDEELERHLRHIGGLPIGRQN